MIRGRGEMRSRGEERRGRIFLRLEDVLGGCHVESTWREMVKKTGESTFFPAARFFVGG